MENRTNFFWPKNHRAIEIAQKKNPIFPQFFFENRKNQFGKNQFHYRVVFSIFFHLRFIINSTSFQEHKISTHIINLAFHFCFFTFNYIYIYMRQIEPDKGFFFFSFLPSVYQFLPFLLCNNYFYPFTEFVRRLCLCFYWSRTYAFVFVSSVPNGRTPRQKQIMGSH